MNSQQPSTSATVKVESGNFKMEVKVEVNNNVDEVTSQLKTCKIGGKEEEVTQVAVAVSKDPEGELFLIVGFPGSEFVLMWIDRFVMVSAEALRQAVNSGYEEHPHLNPEQRMERLFKILSPESKSFEQHLVIFHDKFKFNMDKNDVGPAITLPRDLMFTIGFTLEKKAFDKDGKVFFWNKDYEQSAGKESWGYAYFVQELKKPGRNSLERKSEYLCRLTGCNFKVDHTGTASCSSRLTNHLERSGGGVGVPNHGWKATKFLPKLKNPTKIKLLLD